MRIVFFSLTGQTRRLASKLQKPIWETANELTELSPINPFLEIEEPFLLLVPSYEEVEVRELFYDFLETGKNIQYCVGMVGSGNRNFGDLFLVTAKDLREKYGVPILYDVEFHGTDRDINAIENLLEEISSLHLKG